MKPLLDALDRLFHILSAVAFALVSACVLIQVVARYTPAFSTPWTDEMTRLFFLYTVMLASPMALKYREYAVIDILTSALGERARRVQRVIVLLLVGAVGVVGVSQSLLFFRVGRRIVSTSLAINMGYFYVIPLGIFALTSLYCVFGIAGEFVNRKDC